MKPKTKKSKKTTAKSKGRGRPKVRPGCEYVRVHLDIPAWMAEKLSGRFLKEGRSSRNKLIEWVLAAFLGYDDKDYANKCKAEARKEAKD